MYLHVLAHNDDSGYFPHQLIECKAIAWRRAEDDTDVLTLGSDPGDYVLPYGSSPVRISALIRFEDDTTHLLHLRGGTIYVENDDGKTVEVISG